MPNDKPILAKLKQYRSPLKIKIYVSSRLCLLLTKWHKAFCMDAANGLDLKKLGSVYGGWVVPVNLVKTDWICYSGGVGEDVSFDEKLIRQFGCHVWAFDPTPKAIKYVEREKKRFGPNFHFLNYGLWSSEMTLRFHVPEDPDNASFSVLKLSESDEFVEALCKSVPQLMKELGHDRVDLLKIDVEGAEYEVLKSVLNGEVKPRVLCVEYDMPASPFKMHGCVKALKRLGYRLVSIDEFNYTYLRRD
jgi:FkbM family methyltransferase